MDKVKIPQEGNLQGLFQDCSSLEELDLRTFYTSNVKDMSFMFKNCSALIKLTLGENFNTSNVTNMMGMFYNCSSLTELNLGEKFNSSNVTSMYQMFQDCKSLTSLDLGERFDTSNVTSMRYMFWGCSSLTGLNLGENFYTSSVKNMNSMFRDCGKLTELNLGENFNTGNVEDMQSMFSGCGKLTELNLGENFNTPKKPNMNYIFQGCSFTTLKGLTILNDSIDIKYIYLPNTLREISIKTVQDIVLPKPERADRGYIFGWYDNAELKGTSLVDSKVLANTEMETYYLGQNPIPYSIEYYIDNQEQTNNDWIKSCTIEDDVKLPVPTSADLSKKFDGWYSDESFTGDKITSFEKGQTENMKLYGRWVDKTADEYIKDIFEINDTKKAYTSDKLKPTISINDGFDSVDYTVIYKQNNQVVDPVNAGEYDVYIKVNDSNYADTEVKIGRMTITKADNSWTTKPSINNWTYGSTPSQPKGEAKFGEVVFTYSTSENGKYVKEQPIQVGSYYMKAEVVGEMNYQGISDIVSFDIMSNSQVFVSTVDNQISRIDMNEETKQILIEDAKELPAVQKAIKEGKNVITELVVKEVKDVNKEDQETVERFFKENNSIGQVLDISILIKDEDGKELGMLSETSQKIKINVLIPEDLRKDNREYSIYRIHNGKVERLAGIYNEPYYTIETDKFSTYILTYQDQSTNTVETSDTTMILEYMSLIGLCGLGLIYLRRKKNS